MLSDDIELDESIEQWLGHTPELDTWVYGSLVILSKDIQTYEFSKLCMGSKDFKKFSRSTKGLFCRIAFNYNNNKISRVINDLQILMDNQIDLEYIINRVRYLINNKVYANLLLDYVKN